MTIVNASENTPLATAIRGYDRAAVDAAIAHETAQLRSLQSRAAFLERELSTPPMPNGTPAPRQRVQEALDLIGAGWDDAIRVTAGAEHLAAMSRSHAEHSVTSAMATLEEQCQQAERTADETARGMVAAAREHAARLREQTAVEHDRVVDAAAALVRASRDKAEEVVEQFAAAQREADELQAARIATRYEGADREVAAAREELATAERVAAEIAARAEAAREEILAQARAVSEELLIAAGAEVRRRREENEAALAELGRLLIATGDRLVVAPGA